MGSTSGALLQEGQLQRVLRQTVALGTDAKHAPRRSTRSGFVLALQFGDVAASGEPSYPIRVPDVFRVSESFRHRVRPAARRERY